MKKILLLLILVRFATFAQDQKVSFVKVDGEKKIDVMIGGSILHPILLQVNQS